MSLIWQSVTPTAWIRPFTSSVKSGYHHRQLRSTALPTKAGSQSRCSFENHAEQGMAIPETAGCGTNWQPFSQTTSR